MQKIKGNLALAGQDVQDLETQQTNTVEIERYILKERSFFHALGPAKSDVLILMFALKCAEDTHP